MCEHLFVTAEGSSYTRFLRALNTGNLHLARTAAMELPQVRLRDAVRMVALMLEDEALYERAAVRWVVRFADECPEATLDQVAEALGALRSMTWDVDEGARRLVALCDLHHV